MTVKLYRNNSDSRVVDKDITFIRDYDCILYNASSVTNIVLKLKNIPEGNYIYIPYLNRYYYIVDVVTDSQCCYVTCKCDVLKTYKDNIYGTEQMISRCETLRDNMLVDTAFNMSSDVTLYSRAFGDNVITNHFTYILGVI